MEATSTTDDPRSARQRRQDRARRIDLAREVLLPVARRDDPDARTVRAAWHLLGDAARELIEEEADA